MSIIYGLIKNSLIYIKSMKGEWGIYIVVCFLRLVMPGCDELTNVLKKDSNIIVTKVGCPFCIKAVDLLNEWKIEFRDFDGAKNRSLDEAIRTKYSHNTFPKIFLKGKFIGGFDKLSEYVKTKEFIDLFGPKK